MEVLGKGVIQYVSGAEIISSRGFNLYSKEIYGWRKWCPLPVSFRQKIFSVSQWVSRLTRNEIYQLININEYSFACFAFGSIFLINIKTKSAQKIGNIRGSRPLCVCSDGNRLYYGVYKSNAQREPIEIWSFSMKNEEWKIFHTFNNVRHVHGVFWDNYEAKLWSTTGDLDHESTIWRFDFNGVPHKVVTGSQHSRVVQLIFSKHYIFFATDAPEEINFIYRMDRVSNNIEKRQKVGGPVFYGCKAGKWIFFSTIVEPSKLNRKSTVELWGSSDEGLSWKLFSELKKDLLPKKLFQYGQIKFPSGPGDGRNLYFSPYATCLSHKIIKLSLKNLK